MSDSRVALGMDRLPWLHDEPKPAAPTARGSYEILGWIVAGMLLIGGGSYFAGIRAGGEGGLAGGAAHTPAATIRLPEARPTSSSPETVQPVVPPEVERVASPEVAAPEPALERHRPEAAQSRSAPSSTAERKPAPSTSAPPVSKPSATAASKPLTLWPATKIKGAAGRIVQIGAFGTRLQAKLGWRYMARAYPAVKHLPAIVVDARNSKGRRFYRFQIGTTSQAHSEVLCQRMEKIHLSCAVVGLPGERKPVER